jgi:hypothetical protein
MFWDMLREVDKCLKCNFSYFILLHLDKNAIILYNIILSYAIASWGFVESAAMTQLKKMRNRIMKNN